MIWDLIPYGKLLEGQALCKLIYLLYTSLIFLQSKQAAYVDMQTEAIV